jgi:hypothetical protein
MVTATSSGPKVTLKSCRYRMAIAERSSPMPAAGV